LAFQVLRDRQAHKVYPALRENREFQVYKDRKENVV
jgi:hypothetical protein